MWVAIGLMCMTHSGSIDYVNGKSNCTAYVHGTFKTEKECSIYGWTRYEDVDLKKMEVRIGDQRNGLHCIKFSSEGETKLIKVYKLQEKK